MSKRFTSFLVVVGALLSALFFGDAAQFAAFAQSLGLAYGVYLTGQSATDWQKAKSNGT